MSLEIQEQMRKKNPLYGLDIEAEYEAIIKGKSKLPAKKRNRIVLLKKVEKQTAIVNKLNIELNKERKELNDLLRELDRLDKK